MADNFREADLYPPLRDFLENQGYEVRSELNHCDITAVKNGLLIVVELKRGLTLDLLSQAANRQKFADLVYMAVPKPKKLLYTAKWRDLSHLIRRLELGLLLVTVRQDGTSYVEVAVEPAPFDREKSRQQNRRKRTKALQEFEGRHLDQNIGGSTGRKLVTAYREQALHIACCLERIGPSSPKRLRELGTDPKKTGPILQKDHYGWFERVQNGVYQLSEAGKAGLAEFRELAEYYRAKLEGPNGEAGVHDR